MFHWMKHFPKKKKIQNAFIKLIEEEKNTQLHNS